MKVKTYDIWDLDECLESLPVEPELVTVVQPRVNTSPERKLRQGIAYVDTFETGLDVGDGRNDKARHAGAVLLNDLEIPFTNAYPIIQEWNSKNTSPLSEKELQSAFQNGQKYAKRSPGNKLVDQRMKITARPDNPEETPLPPEDKPRRRWTRKASTFKVGSVKWFWDNRFLKYNVNMLVGIQGSGKSWLLMDMIARLTTGKALERDKARPPMEVTYISDEDDTEDGIMVRLTKFDVNLDMVNFINLPKEGEDGIPKLNLNDHPEQLDEIIDDNPDAELLIFDPIKDWVGDLENNSEGQVRAFWSRIEATTRRRKVTVIFVMHYNKKEGLSVINRVAGSGAWTQKCRCVQGVVQDKGDKTIRYFGEVKCNHSIEATGLRFSLSRKLGFQWLDGDWEGSINDEMQTKATTKIEDCVDWLEEILREHEEKESVIKSRAKARGFDKQMLAKAKKRSGHIDSKHEGGFGSEGYWVWFLI